MHSEAWQRRNLKKDRRIGRRPQNQKDHLALNGPWKDKGAQRPRPQERRKLCDWQVWVKGRLLFILPMNLVHLMQVPPAVT